MEEYTGCSIPVLSVLYSGLLNAELAHKLTILNPKKLI